MKRISAILLSAALVLSQAAFLIGAQTPESQAVSKPKCCGSGACCKGGQCCKSQNGPVSPQPAPGIPFRNLSQNDWQLAAFALTVQLFSRTAAELLPSSSLAFSFSSVAAPLYQRNCSYII